MAIGTQLSANFDRALTYATWVHAGQVRKQTSIPYIAHLLAVAATVLEYGGDEATAIAALLHDAAEDQGGEGRLSDIEARFGSRVANIVRGCSDDLPEPGKEKAEWKARKRNYIHHLRSTDSDTLLVSLADKVHNARSILRDLRNPEIGENVWARFSKPKECSLWYYRELALVFAERRPGQLAQELSEIVGVLEAGG